MDVATKATRLKERTQLKAHPRLESTRSWHPGEQVFVLQLLSTRHVVVLATPRRFSAVFRTLDVVGVVLILLELTSRSPHLES